MIGKFTNIVYETREMHIWEPELRPYVLDYSIIKRYVRQVNVGSPLYEEDEMLAILALNGLQPVVSMDLYPASNIGQVVGDKVVRHWNKYQRKMCNDVVLLLPQKPEADKVMEAFLSWIETQQ